jgi:cytochrome c oxidase assembly protein subunit 15
VLRGPLLLRRAAFVSLGLNVLLVITGGAVRLTGSGLGCPTWPRCADASYRPSAAQGYHGLIEDGNRLLSGMVGVVAAIVLVLTLLQWVRDRRQVGWAAATLAGIPTQAVLGGITVLTDLNPWVVACHFLASMAVIFAAYRLWLATGEPGGVVRPRVGAPLRALNGVLLAVTGAVLVVGTVVTGSGPHAGDEKAHRTGLDPGMVAQLHADLVMLLIGLSVAWYFALRAVDAPPAARRAALVLVVVELAQGAIGFVQYFTHLPALLVGLHLAGACAVWLAALRTQTAIRVREAQPVTAPAPAATVTAAAR